MVRSILVSFTLLFSLTTVQANNGEFITAEHRWHEITRAVVPLYIGVDEYEKNLKELNGVQPQANCTVTLIKGGKQFLTASHCFQALCPALNRSGKNKLSDYFLLVDGKKISIEKMQQHPDYCRLAHELEIKDRVKPNPMFPEWAYDVGIGTLSDKMKEQVRKSISHFPTLRLDEKISTNQEVYNSIGFGVSDRYIPNNTKWADHDSDNVHDYWDMCSNTKVKLIPDDQKWKAEKFLHTNGCSSTQRPDFPVKVLDYFTATKISHKRGYSLTPFVGGEKEIYGIYRIDPTPFISHLGHKGSLRPYKNGNAMSFGGDSGGPLFNENFSEIVGVTLLFHNYQEYVRKKIMADGTKMTYEEKDMLWNSGFNSFLKLSVHKEFLKNNLLP